MCGMKPFALPKNHKIPTQLDAFSDACGGQNRNVKIALFSIHVVLRNDIPLEVFDHKFLESGHYFGPSDSDFADIERKAKKKDTVYTPGAWYDIIEESRIHKKFEVNRMKPEQFIGSKDSKIQLHERIQLLKVTRVSGLISNI